MGILMEEGYYHACALNCVLLPFTAIDDEFEIVKV